VHKKTADIFDGFEDVVTELEKLGNPKDAAGMARFGITAKRVLGISTPSLRLLARRVGKNHELAVQLWKSGIFEARILAAFIAEPDRLTKRLARSWAGDFENWADCDGVCIHLFRKTGFAHELAVEWIEESSEYVKRAGFTMMATLAVHDKAAPDKVFLDYLPLIEAAADDERNGVKKAVNWALRQIGKRNPKLRIAAIRTGESIRARGTRSSRWIASDALRELNHYQGKK
jgi:3-methyladenine DNA glycosylase AlkD